MTHRLKKVGLMLIAAVILVTLAFAGAVSADTPTASGNCGKDGGANLKWAYYDSTKTLVITGSGEMENFEAEGVSPWNTYRDSITNVTLPAGLQNIGDYAFYGFTVLEAITIPASVETIGNGAFRANDYKESPPYSKLTTVTFAPNSKLKTIGDGAFAYSDALERIDFPVSVETIGTELVLVSEVGPFAYCTALTNVTFAEGSKLKTIGCEAFAYCTTLTSIEIPANVETICFCAFCGDQFSDPHSVLTTVTFAPNSKLKTIGAAAFQHSGLTDIKIPASVETIGTGAFAFCPDLTEVTFADDSKLKEIGQQVFQMSGLESIEIPKNVEAIGNRAFAGDDRPGRESWSVLTTITFAEGSKLKTIGENAFLMSHLESITIPKSVETIGENAFEQCPDLTEVTFADVSKLKTIGNWIFSFDANLKKVLIPKETFSQGAAFGDALFLGCTNFNAVISDKLQAPEVMGKFVASPAKMAANQVAAEAGVIKPVWYISEVTSLSGDYDDYFIGLLNGGTLDADFEQQKIGETTFTLPDADNVTRTGYTFDKWIDTGKTKVTTLTDSSKHATLNWKPDVYDITYLDVGGTPFSGDNLADLPATHTYGTATTLVDGSKSGYTFDGWFDNALGIGTSITTLGATDYTSGITLYAKWTPIATGHSPSIPKDYTPSGYVEPMEQQTAKPTATPTPAAPTVMPTSKPTATTSKSPAPVAGLVLGLGAAALLIRMRR